MHEINHSTEISFSNLFMYKQFFLCGAESTESPGEIKKHPRRLLKCRLQPWLQLLRSSSVCVKLSAGPGHKEAEEREKQRRDAETRGRGHTCTGPSLLLLNTSESPRRKTTMKERLKIPPHESGYTCCLQGEEALKTSLTRFNHHSFRCPSLNVNISLHILIIDQTKIPKAANIC